jgi:hypothetical protein
VQEEERQAAAQLAARGAYEEDQAVLRVLRMALRTVSLALLDDRRWKWFAAPPAPDMDPEYWLKVGAAHTSGSVL